MTRERIIGEASDHRHQNLGSLGVALRAKALEVRQEWNVKTSEKKS